TIWAARRCNFGTTSPHPIPDRRSLHAHRHQHVERAVRILVLDKGRRAGIGKLEHGGFALDLRGNVEEVARIETDIDRIGSVFDLDLLGGAAGIRIGDGQQETPSAQRQFDGTAALARDRRDAIDRSLELLFVDDEFLVVVQRDDATVIGKRSVDQLRGQDHLADGEANFSRRQLNRLRSAALSVNLCVISPGARSGKSLSGSDCSVNRERPARIESAARSPEDSRTICAPSGSLRTMSKNMWAGTVVDPPGATSAAMVSVTSTSRSVALRLSFERSARNSTLARIGMVLRLSTTRCTWPSDLSNSERSTVIFIAKSVHE